MRKIVRIISCIISAMLLAGNAATAQIHLGLKGGVNVSSIDLNENLLKSYNVTGFHIGPLLEVMAPMGVGFDAAVLYSQKGVEVKGADVVMTDYLEVPANLKLKFGIPIVKLYLTGGPFIQFRLSKETDKWDRLQSELKAKAFAAGLNFGAGVEIFSRIQVGANYGIGLTDNYAIDKIENVTDIKVKSKTISVTAVLLF